MAELSRAIARLMDEQRRERAPRPQTVAPSPPARESATTALPPGERGLAGEFVRIFAAAPGAAGLEERHLTTVAMAAFRYLAERTVEEPRVRAFVPDVTPDAWDRSGTALQVVMRDRPHIVDTVRECMRDADCRVRRVIAPTFQVERDVGRAVLKIAEPGPVGPRETFVHVEIERHPEPQVVANLVADRLRDLILATEDEPSMRARAIEAAAELRSGSLPRPWNLEAGEAAAFLDWLATGHFVFLGYREYELSGQGLERLARVRPGSGLGILQSEDLSQYAQTTPLSEPLRRRMHEPPLLMLSKANARSTVLRREAMDYVGLKRFDAAGVVVGERRFLGLYSDTARAQTSSEVPILRAKLVAVLEAEGESAETRSGRRIVHAFDALPRSEVLALTPEALVLHVRAVLTAPEQTNAHIEYHADALDRGAVVMVSVPRNRFARETFEHTEQRLVQVSGATAVLDRHLFVAEDHVRMHFFLAARADSVASFHPDELRGPVLELLRTWEDRLRDELRRLLPPHEIDAAVARYSAALPDAYKASREIRKTARDIIALESVRTGRRPVLELHDDPRAPGRFGFLELFHADPDFIVGNWIRSLGRFGLGVHDVSDFEVRSADESPLYLVTLRVRDDHGPLDFERTGKLLVRAFERLQAGTLSDDDLNALIPRAGLDWRQVDVLRACVAYAVQRGLVSSHSVAEQAVVRHPQSARLLWEWFDTKFDPMDAAPAHDREARAGADAHDRFQTSLLSVDGEVDRECLRRIGDVIAALTRTNYYLSSVSGTALDDPTVLPPALALEIAPAQLVPAESHHVTHETFVDGPLVTGFHLRSGAVALGPVSTYPTADGLRARLQRELAARVATHGEVASDAARAGFVIKGTATSARLAAGFRAFTGALLDLVDNIQEGRPRHAPGIVAYDGLDPYRALAPGRGTAPLIEVAAELARQRQLWLGAGFAPLAGAEDAKAIAALGARIAWDALHRHLWEAGRNPNAESLDLVAVGDLAQRELLDALLVSRRIVLRAAVDSRWILIDPSPDPARAFAARERLLTNASPSWESYDREALGPGGGIYPRAAATLELSAGARDLLGLEAAQLSPHDVINAILRLPADALFCAGGTNYVIAPIERQDGAIDRPDVFPRIDADQLGARHAIEISPGTFTPAARVAFALNGGRFDSIADDLAPAVQLRDRMVNVEIAAGPASEGPRLPNTERLPLLAEAKARNAEITRGRCRDQVRAIDIDRARSITSIDDYSDAITLLADAAELDRRREHLPEREALRRRRGQFLGLTHPEIAALSAQTKLWLRRALRDGAIADDAFFERYLRGYFPEIVDRRCSPGVRSHRLRRSIIAAEVSSALLTTMGSGFLARLQRDTGARIDAIVRCWAVAVEIGGLRELWRAVADADPPLPHLAELRCWTTLAAGAERATRWLLRTQPPDATATGLYETFAATVVEVGSILESALPAALAGHTAATVEQLSGLGVPRMLGEPIALASRLAERFDIATIVLERNLTTIDVAAGYYRICDLLDLEWLDRRLAEIVPADRWERSVVLGLADDLMTMRNDFSLAVFAANPDAVDADAAITAYLVDNQHTLTRIGRIIDDVTTAPRVTLTALSVVIREISQLARSGA